MPAVESIANARKWQLDTYILGICQPTFGEIPYPYPVNGVTPDEQRSSCKVLLDETFSRLENTGYDLVILATFDPRTKDPSIYSDTIERLVDAKLNVLVLRDTAAPLDTANPTPACLERNAGSPAACGGLRTTWIRRDPLTEAAESIKSPLVHRADLNNYLCGPIRCEAIIGRVVVFSDANHMSATYVKTLAPFLEPKVAQAMGEP